MMPDLEAVDLPQDAVEVGRIVDAWGIKGWFKVLPHSAAPQALLSAKRWFLLPSERGAKIFSGVRVVEIVQAKMHSESIVATSSSVQDRDAAEALRGARIFVSRETFPTPAPDEYYWVDLIGMSVVNREAVELGTVHELLSTGAQTVLVLQQGEAGKTTERMIPFVAVYIDDVDLSSRRIRVDWQPDF